MKTGMALACAAWLCFMGVGMAAAKGGLLPPPPPAGRMAPPGKPGLPPPLPRTPLPKPMRQIQVPRPVPIPGSPIPPAPLRLNPPSPYQMVPPPPARQPGMLPSVRLLPPSPYERPPEVPRMIFQPQRTSPLGPYRLGPVVSFTSLSYLPPVPVRTPAAQGDIPSAAEQEEMKAYWEKVRSGTASAEERMALEALVRKYSNYDFARG